MASTAVTCCIVQQAQTPLLVRTTPAGTLAFLPVLFIIGLIYTIVTYWMIGLAPGVMPFFTFLAGIFLTLAVANSFVLFFGGFVPNFAIGVTLSTAIFAFFFLCSGFFIPRYWNHNKTNTAVFGLPHAAPCSA